MIILRMEFPDIGIARSVTAGYLKMCKVRIWFPILICIVLCETDIMHIGLGLLH